MVIAGPQPAKLTSALTVGWGPPGSRGRDHKPQATKRRPCGGGSEGLRRSPGWTERTCWDGAAREPLGQRGQMLAAEAGARPGDSIRGLGGAHVCVPE